MEEKNRFTEEEYKKRLKNNSDKCLRMIQKKRYKSKKKLMNLLKS